MPGKDTKRVSWKRVGLCLAIIFAAGYVVDSLAMHVGVWYEARKAASDPRASIMPQHLPNSDVADLKGGSVSAFGYSFSVPWKVSKRRQAKTVSTLVLSNGAEITIFQINKDGMGPGLIGQSTPSQVAAMRSIYGSWASSSKYGWLDTELNSSPADVALWRSRESNARVLVSLMFKAVEVQKAKAIYPLSSGTIHGFQLGDPQQPSSVFLRLFDANDGELWMILHRASNGVGFTQEQINAMVASIRPATPEVAKP